MSSRVQETQPIASIDGLSQRLPPLLVVQVPKHGFPKAGLERLPCSPAQFLLDFGRIDRIAAVVARPVRNKADQLASGGRVRINIVNNGANLVYDLEVRPLTTATDIVLAAQSAVCEDPNQGPHMILDIKPIANIATIAVHREWLAFDGV